MAMRLNLCLGNLHKKLHTGVFELVVGLGFWLIYHIRLLLINSKLDVKLTFKCSDMGGSWGVDFLSGSSLLVWGR